MAQALEGMELPPDVALQPGKVFYRAGDHQLMPQHLHRPGASARRRTRQHVHRRERCRVRRRRPLADTGCKMTYPS